MSAPMAGSVRIAFESENPNVSDSRATMKPGAMPAVAPGADFPKPILFIERTSEDIENYPVK
jgi:hypothetical protein